MIFLATTTRMYVNIVKKHIPRYSAKAITKKYARKKYKNVNLVQISQKDNNFDENAQLALEFLSQQFPKDYP